MQSPNTDSSLWPTWLVCSQVLNSLRGLDHSIVCLIFTLFRFNCRFLRGIYWGYSQASLARLLSIPSWWFSPSVMSDSCDPMDCSLPASSVHGIFQARILDWVAIFFSRGSSLPRNRTHVSCVSCLAGGFFTTEPPGKPCMLSTFGQKKVLAITQIFGCTGTISVAYLTQLSRRSLW